MNNASTLPSSRIQDAFKTQNWQALITECNKVLRKKPKDLFAHRYFGFALRRLDRNEEALSAYAKAIVYWPGDAEVLMNYGQTLLEVGKDFAAIPFFEKATKLRPEKYLTWMKLSQALYRCQNHKDGYECAKKMHAMADIHQEKVNSLVHLALHEREFGKVKEAIAHCSEALALEPTEVTAHTNRLLFMLADPDVNAEALKTAAEQYAAAVEPLYLAIRQAHDGRARSPSEHLRVGFLSPDFRNHSVMYFMEGVLAQMDRRQFTVIGLGLHGGCDSITDRAKAYVNEFIDLTNRPFPAQLEQIRQAKLDILIDLAGHTGNNGLAFMACKPAPVQATWIGYPGTTGLKTIDYLITDVHTDPPGVDYLYSEKLLRLDSRLCVYRPLIRNPLYRYQPAYAVKPSPALTNGFVTFGSCNNLGKLTDEVLATWAAIVNRVPGSKMLIEGKGFEQEETVRKYRERCLSLGFQEDHLVLLPLDARNQYLTYHQIDIALDPFPLNGGTTSMDVLWMGVPLVAMAGRSFRDRLTAGILLHLGRPEWLVESRENYIQRACDLAADVGQLNALRLGLRNELEQSILMREDRFCHRLGLSLRQTWLQWLAEARFPGQPTQQIQYVEQSWRDLPSEWMAQTMPGVGLKPGQRVSLPEAQTLMEKALQKAKEADTKAAQGSIKRPHPCWNELTALCDTVLASVPNEPFALACLAEVEHASGHTDFAVTYLRYAQTAIALNTQVN